MIKRHLSVLFLLFAILFSMHSRTVNAQSVELMGGNILNGALTGTVLGVGVMGLQNSDDFAPLRVGLGAGILGGAATAVYDITTLPRGQQFFISGTFNDGNNSSIIILLDTIYGAGAGAVLGAAVMLIQNERIAKGFQYGGGAGVWAGFAFGLADAFMLAERNRDFTAARILNRSSILKTEFGSLNIEIGEPVLYRTPEAAFQADSYKLSPGFKLFSIGSQF